jgi:hypothetical protein
MEKYQIENSEEFKAAMQLEDALNDMCFDEKKFAESIRFMHPTLQQSFFRLMKECILFMADDKKRYIDDRNRASYEGSRRLAEILKETGVPFI